MKALIFFRIMVCTATIIVSACTTFAQDKSARALDFLLNAMKEENEQLVVYRDFGDGATRFTQRALLNSTSTPEYYPVMDEKAPSKYGVTCIHVTYPMTKEDWNGYIFITGRLEQGSISPQLDFGEHNTGHDLQGAKRLTFKARGITGNERIRFYMGGLGGTDAEFRDTGQKFLNNENYVTLTKEWKEYTIDLSGVDLSRIGSGFGWVTSQIENKGVDTLEFELDDIIYHFDREQFNPLFLRSYEALSIDDERSFINNFSYVYDNALLAILLAKSGNINYARQVADAIAYCVNNDRYYEPGPIRNAYANGVPTSFPGWFSVHNKEFAMLPGFYNTDIPVWYEDRYAVSINTGVMAWAIEALLTVYDEINTRSYLESSILMADYIIDNFSTTDAIGGFTGGYEGWEGDTQKLTYKSTEHNIDIYSAFMHLSDILKNSDSRKAEKYSEAAKNARDFVMEMYENGCFYTGTGNDGITPSVDNKPLDTNTWAILTMLNDDESRGRWNPEAVLAFIEQTFKVGEGVDYNQDKDGIWNEGTAQLALAALQMNHKDEYDRLMKYLNEAAEDDGSIRAASKDGLTTGFESLIATEGGGLKAIPWTYDNRVSLASTAWLGLAQLQTNPYYTNNEMVIGNSSLSLFPNPARDRFTLNGLQAGESIAIYDLKGNRLLVTMASGQNETIDISMLSQGLYHTTVGKNSNNPRVAKLIVK
ncbi:MAG: T9SS type A sorting domain-containing protein [Tannerella sp.]|jgi:hypothetical protein|nr:T9SS type A sorting domain-containing protein [Tannerella sp.]